VAVSYATPRLWTYSGSGAQCWINGYYVVDPTNAYLLWAQQLDSSILMASDSDAVEVTPAFAIGSRYQ
jgi:hypothetical protein